MPPALQDSGAEHGETQIPQCTLHTDRPATAFCTHCSRPFSATELTIRSDGRAICHVCVRVEAPPLHTERLRTDRDLVWQGGLRSLARRFFWMPRELFLLPEPLRIGRTVAIGYAATLFGYAAWLGWLVLHDPSHVRDTLTQAGIEPDSGPGGLPLELVPWLALPALALIRLVGTALLLHSGTMLAGASGLRFRSTLRVSALASVGLLLCAIPQWGSLLAYISWSWILMAWLVHEHRFGVFRSLLALLPALFSVVLLLGPALPSG